MTADKNNPWRISEFDHPDHGWKWTASEVRWIEERIAAAVAATLAEQQRPNMACHDPRPWGFQDLMAVAAFRYCCGRQSYIVGVCVNWIIKQWPNFAENAKSIIHRDLEEEFKRDGEFRERGESYKPLGSDCDRADWARVRKLWASEKVTGGGFSPSH